MIRRVSRNFLAATCAATTAAALSGCGLLHAENEPRQEAASRERPAPHKLVQLGFGRDAVFAACIEPVCPAVTPKTLATARQTEPVGAAAGAEVARNRDVAIQAREITSPTALTSSRVPLRLREKQTPTLVLRFPVGGVEFSRFDNAALEKLVPLASKADRIVIAGRTDSVGSDTANQAVAVARANAVRDYLRSKLALPDETFMIDARGSCCYIASNDTPEGRKQNRRVEIVLRVAEQVAQ